MRFAKLGSGSRGNAVVVESGGTRVLVDCGFSLAEAERRLARLGLTGSDLDAVLLTHEHIDHVRGVAQLARRHRLAVWATPGSFAAWAPVGLPGVELFSPHEPFAVGDLEIWPYPVPHDAREPCQFVIGDGARRLGLLCDVGRVTPHVRAMVDDCDALILECNHDVTMLAAGPYPAFLKRRVGGGLGHLSNDQASALLAGLDTRRLQHVVAAHLSEKNNTPAAACAALAVALNCTPDWVSAATQGEVLEWRSIATR